MKLHGLDAVLLENEWLKISILPEVGGKIYDLIYKPTSRNFLWHNPRIIPQAYAIEANFDNYWCGGWDEGFPTCDECDHAGEHYPNLGELRSLRWTVEAVEQTSQGMTAEISAFGPISSVQVRKTITLHREKPSVSVRSQITNLGPRPIDYIWGTHPAVNPGRNALLRIPAKTGIVGLASHPSLGMPEQRYVWPVLETPTGQTDMSLTQPKEAGIFCGHYATDLEHGWYAIEDLDTREGFLLSFPKEQCPYLWMWLVYGGWRGYRHVILEPWTSYPVHLAEAAKRQKQRVLKSDETFEVMVSATIYSPSSPLEKALNEAGTLTIE